MDAELAGQFTHGAVTFDGGQRHLRLERGAVLLAGLLHVLLLWSRYLYEQDPRIATCLKFRVHLIAQARTLERATMRNIRQNLSLAYVYDTLGVPVAAGVFYPLFGWTLSPIIAAAAIALSSVSIVGNALRLCGTRL